MSDRGAGRVATMAEVRRRSDREPTGDREPFRALAAQLGVAEERERRRIARGLHDRVGQLLGVAKIKLGEALEAGPRDAVAAPLAEARQLVDRAIQEIRSLTFELSSPVLHELGLEAALVCLAERMEERHGIRCRCDREASPLKLPEASQVLLHSLTRELLWNVVKHAAASRVVLAIRRDADGVRIVVEDDGTGFDAVRVLKAPSESAGLGLFGARERLRHLGGELEIDSVLGRGTTVTMCAPLSR